MSLQLCDFENSEHLGFVLFHNTDGMSENIFIIFCKLLEGKLNRTQHMFTSPVLGLCPALPVHGKHSKIID